jgi:hypothetical protein
MDSGISSIAPLRCVLAFRFYLHKYTVNIITIHLLSGDKEGLNSKNILSETPTHTK